MVNKAYQNLSASWRLSVWAVPKRFIYWEAFHYQ